MKESKSVLLWKIPQGITFWFKRNWPFKRKVISSAHLDVISLCAAIGLAQISSLDFQNENEKFSSNVFSTPSPQNFDTQQPFQKSARSSENKFMTHTSLLCIHIKYYILIVFSFSCQFVCTLELFFILVIFPFVPKHLHSQKRNATTISLSHTNRISPHQPMWFPSTNVSGVVWNQAIGRQVLLYLFSNLWVGP